MRHHEIWQKEQRRKEAEEAKRKQEELKNLWTASQMYKLIRWSSEVEYGKPLITNNDNLPFIKALCFFLSEDERFETELGFSLKKGLIIRGISGLGKTHLMKCVSKNELNPVLILSMIEIADDVRHNGEFNIPGGKYTKIYLDDVGSEEATVNHYGTKINWFKDFLEIFYLKDRQYNSLMISTNNSFSEIEQKYGFRVRSRIKDMFNIIDVDGKDLRGL